jgi:hypothetical protein
VRAILADIALRDLEDFLGAADDEAAEATLAALELISPEDGSTSPIRVGALATGATAVAVSGLVRSYQDHGEPYERMQSPLAQCRSCRAIYAVGPAVVHWAESASPTARSDGFEPGEPWHMRMQLGYEPHTELAERRSVYLMWARLSANDTAMR